MEMAGVLPNVLLIPMAPAILYFLLALYTLLEALSGKSIL